jgi:hypothetical protein
VEWSQRGFSEYEVADSRSNKWEYQENEIMLGSKYKDLEAVKDVVKLWSILLRKEF